MDRKKKYIILCVGMLLILCICIGLSYAYYMFNISQKNSNAITGDCFRISFEGTDNINLNNATPMEESEANNLTPYTFTIRNICNTDADFDIDVETLNTTDMELNSIRFKIDDYESNILGSLRSKDSQYYINDNVKSSHTIKTSSLLAGEEKTFNVRFWIDINSSAEQSASKIFESKIVINSRIRYYNSYAQLDDGDRVSSKIAALGKKAYINPESIDFNTILQNYTINSIKRSLFPPSENIEYIDISSVDSSYPIYAWVDIDYSQIHEITKQSYNNSYTFSVYYASLNIYCQEEKIFLNPDSAFLFARFSSLENIDLSYFDTSKVTNMSYMFGWDSSLKNLDLSHFDTSNVTNMSGMFTYMDNLTSLDISSFNTSKVTDMSQMFAEMNNLANLDVSHFDTSKVTNMKEMFEGMNNLTSLDVSHFDTSNVTNMYMMFWEDTNLTSLDVSHFDTSKVTNMSFMFADLENLTSLDVSHFDTSNVIYMYDMFYELKNITSLDVSHFDTSKVTNMSQMFTGLENITSLDVSHFNTSQVTNMSQMFAGLKNITTLDLSSFDTSKVTNMSYMFSWMNNLITVYVGSNWNTQSVSQSNGMFTNLTNIVGGAGTTYNASHIDKEYARADGGASNPGYLTLKTT